MPVVYPNLEKAARDSCIPMERIADAIGISAKAFTRRLSGRSRFTWWQACAIQRLFFPWMQKDYLFATDMPDTAVPSSFPPDKRQTASCSPHNACRTCPCAEQADRSPAQ